jgi:hypothetical protein
MDADCWFIINKAYKYQLNNINEKNYKLNNI